MRYLLLLLCVFCSCSKDKALKSNEEKTSDSLAHYLTIANNTKNKETVRLKALNNASDFYLTLDENQQNRDSLFSISYKYYSFKDWENFSKTNSLLISQSLAKKDTTNLIKAYRYRGGYYKNIKVYDSSFIYYRNAEKLCLKTNNQIELGNILLNKGIVQFSVNDYFGAELSLSKAYYIFKSNNENEKVYGALNQLGLVFNELKEYDKAIEYHLMAIQTVKKYNLQSNAHEEAVCYNNIGYLYIKQKKYNEAIVNLEIALRDTKVSVDDPDLYSCLIDNLAYSRLQLNNYSQLPTLFFEALEVRKKLKDLTAIVGSYIHISEYYQKKEDYESATKYALEAILVAKRSQIPINIILALKQASNVDQVNALKYTNDYTRISDSLQIAERTSKDRFARIELETDEIKQENQGLAARNRDLLYVFVVSFILVALLFVVRAQRARTRELLYKQAQQKANEDIYNLMMSQQAIIDESRNKEKKRLAQDLHDGVLGRMFGLRLNLDSLNSNVDEESTHKRFELLNELKTIEQDIREISHDLNREKQVLINNFVSIVHNLLEEQKTSFEVNVNYTIDENVVWDKVGNAIKINLYRILQEGLQNINKYANAKNILVEIKGDKENVYLKIQDDGIGFDVNKKSKGIGMQNMISRTHDCKGIIDINSKKDNGTKIVITIPIETKQPIIVEQE